METFWNILQVSLPALLVGGIVWLMMAKFAEQENQRRRWQLLRTTQQTALPIRFTAYERMVIFLERITPDCMMVRLQDNALTAKQFHASLLVDIRAEYEHNVSQQLYMSDEAWTVVKNAKESIVQLVNACAAQLPPDAPSMDLAKLILATYGEASQASPTETAIEVLKQEIKNYFA